MSFWDKIKKGVSKVGHAIESGAKSFAGPLKSVGTAVLHGIEKVAPMAATLAGGILGGPAGAQMGAQLGKGIAGLGQGIEHGNWGQVTSSLTTGLQAAGSGVFGAGVAQYAGALGGYMPMMAQAQQAFQNPMAFMQAQAQSYGAGMIPQGMPGQGGFMGMGKSLAGFMPSFNQQVPNQFSFMPQTQPPTTKPANTSAFSGILGNIQSYPPVNAGFSTLASPFAGWLGA